MSRAEYNDGNFAPELSYRLYVRFASSRLLSLEEVGWQRCGFAGAS